MTNEQVIRVVLADDQSLIRAGFRALLEAEPDIRIVGEAETGVAAVRLAADLVPDLVLMDIRMPVMDGIEATRVITGKEESRNVRVVILTTFDADEYVYDALRVGASGFLLKDAETADLLHGVRSVVRGDALLSPAVTRRLIAAYVHEHPGRPGRRVTELEMLTKREREVLALVAGGLSNDEIAERLVLSPLTAKTHVSRLLAKTGSRDRAQLVVLAYESGLVQPGRPVAG
ncbi:response regulator transcription factor [Kitasatospora sp. RB6PN24]|uniref:response regulator n=1 Tax=Kitasatospora humi TaxID=2893891 RepID=UPI001E324759|nr:response regulator transcription factor [Kitasatospora humi]MCC9310105.1 response regulator transcription factor [Kitasatospora humi]